MASKEPEDITFDTAATLKEWLPKLRTALVVVETISRGLRRTFEDLMLLLTGVPGDEKQE